MARIKAAVNAHKKRRKIMKLAKGYFGSKSKQYRSAKEQVARSLRYAYIGRKLRKRDSLVPLYPYRTHSKPQGGKSCPRLRYAYIRGFSASNTS